MELSPPLYLRLLDLDKSRPDLDHIFISQQAELFFYKKTRRIRPKIVIMIKMKLFVEELRSLRPHVG